MVLKTGRFSHLLKVLEVIACVAPFCSAAELPPPCSSGVYCYGPLLHAVQTARLFDDSKTFVDLRMVKSENETVQDFQNMVNTNPNYTREDLQRFVDGHFVEGDELVLWTPDDFKPDPIMLQNIKDPVFRQFAKDLVGIWPNLGRKVSNEVQINPDRFSLHYLPNGFIVPGGRFKEIYYWDSYWIIEGILLSGMNGTARGMIENFLYLVKKFGHIPNGSRVYYNQRSQPPLLTAMAEKYISFTSDINWLKQNIETIEKELQFWIDHRTVELTRDGRTYTMLRYFAPSSGPRPESYFEDYVLASSMGSESAEQELYVDLKSAAESGWDFSARWFISSNGSNDGNLTNIHTRRIIPVDLNSMFAAALQSIANMNILLSRNREAKKWWSMARSWREAFDVFLWNDEDGIWYDYDMNLGKQRRHFYPTNVAPLWAKAVDEEHIISYAPKVIRYLKANPALGYPGGIPASLDRTGEQWDFPNAWPPLQSMLVLALKNTGLKEGITMSKDLAQIWVRANYLGYKKHMDMFEKYDAESPGEYGGGGEYVVQSGFGWTNGVILELLNLYGQELESAESHINEAA